MMERLLVVIPADLLQALAAPGGGQVAIVIGAGCSIEPPTGMPLAGDLSEETERQLVLDNVLLAGQCANPRDLSALAQLVFDETGSQESIVQRFPLEQMRLARPNSGYKFLVALMVERAVSHVLSLNFDLAVQNAASELGLNIAVISQSGQQVPVRSAVVHLHGTANSASGELILRADVIDAGWKGQWEEIVAQQVLGAPAILFVGLGSAAPVLTATVEMIQGALDGNKTLYQADVSAFANNFFAQQLLIPEERFIQGGWNAVLAKMAERIAADQVHKLRTHGRELLAENMHDQGDQDSFDGLASRCRPLSLLALGKLRAFGVLEPRQLYRPHRREDDEMLAEPLLKLAQLVQHFDMSAEPTPAGTWVLMRQNRTVGQLVLASGGGVRRLAALEPRARAVCDLVAEHSVAPPDFVLVGGVAPGAVQLSHIDIVGDADPTDIIDGPIGTPVISANDADFMQRIGELLHAA